MVGDDLVGIQSPDPLIFDREVFKSPVELFCLITETMLDNMSTEPFGDFACPIGTI
jgi:hypothetical protein